MPGNLPLRCTMVSVLVLAGHAARTRVLLLHRAGSYLHGAWSYVAGHVEHGEAGWQAAVRELREETGLTPEALYATSFCEQFYFAAANRIEVVPAFVARIADHATVQLNAEHSAYQWLTPAAAARRFPFGSQRDLLAHVRREFIQREPAACLRIDIG
jgi:dATP pyrophosphohydrolase